MNSNIKNAIVVSLKQDFSEIIELANSPGYKTIQTFYQKRIKPDVNTFIGYGKLEEIKNFIENSDKNIDLVIFDSELKPSQWFNIEKKLNVDVYDRIRLILTIFEERAESKEAKLQVKLAHLQYERPFVRELIHRARAGEHPGFMAGGEYQVDDYYEMIKKQIKKIKNELGSIRDEREIRRRHRYKSGFYLVSLAGYTNAGKSSLLNLLSDEKIRVEGRLFSTLSTTTRKIKCKKIPVLLTDTVGFIQDLPAYVIDAFHSTLEEIETADIVLLIVDISEDIDVIENKLKVSLNELVELGVESDIIIVFNKADLISDDKISDKINYLKDAGLIEDNKLIVISTKNNADVDLLFEMIYDSIPDLINFKVKLPMVEKTQSLISWIYDKALVNDILYNDHVILSVECNIEIYNKIVSRCSDINGAIY